MLIPATKMSSEKGNRDYYASQVLAIAGDMAEATITAGHAEAIALSCSFVANPDLAQPLKLGVPLSPSNRAIFYCGDSTG